jgi:tetratricopeptide (TPR) repeat protein
LIEQVMYFVLGLLVAGLFMLMSLPAFWRRAKRLSMRRLRLLLPISMEEVVAERDLLRAGFALRELQLEREMAAVRATKAQDMADVGRHAVRIADLDGRLEKSESRAADLETRLRETEKAVGDTTDLLSSTKSELDATKRANSELNEALEETRARLRVFETRHRDEADIERVAQAALNQLAEQRAAPLLLFGDNVTASREISDPLPAPVARPPIISRLPDWGEWAEEAALDELPPGEAIAYLQSRAGREDKAGARTLMAKALGGLPLTLGLAAAYCKRTQMSFAAYAAKASTLMTVAPRGTAYPRGVAAIVGLAIAEAIEQAPGAEALMAFLACCAPERIPLMFAEGAIDDEVERTAALLALTELALVKRDRFEDGTPALRVHRLVQAAARARTDESGGAAAAIERMVNRLAAIYPGDGYDNPASWPLCAQLTPHLLAIRGTETADEAWSEERADLLVRAGGYFHGRAAYARAEPLFRMALAIREKAFGPTHPETAASLDNLASLLYAQGDFAGARPLLERALTIFEKAFGPEYPPTGRHQASCARLLLMTDRPEQALALGEAALATHEKSSGADHPWTKDSGRVTADALDALGRNEEARALRARHGLMTEVSLNPALSETGSAISSLRKYSIVRQVGLGMIKSWRFLLRNSVAKSN